MRSASYILLYVWVKNYALLPLRLLYILSRILYLIIYRLAGYRLKVVRANMGACFPGLGRKELRRMEKDFYRHFADYIVETIKMAHISPAEIRRRMRFVNPQLVDELMNNGHNCILMGVGHFGNWEWCTAGGAFFQDARIWQIYRPLKSRAFDRLFVSLRTRFGSQGIKKREAYRDIVRLKQSNRRAIVAFLADQAPGPRHINYRTTFLNRNTSFLDGLERISKKLDLPVIFADVRRERRGYYSVEFIPITSSPRETPDFFITEQYARLMEQTILRNPALWLWTHKRWKHDQNN
jgi:KDO2-lipid IV(A) lauroyltransferase